MLRTRLRSGTPLAPFSSALTQHNPSPTSLFPPPLPISLNTHTHPRPPGAVLLDGAASTLVDKAWSDSTEFGSTPEGQRVATVGWASRRVYVLVLYVSVLWLVLDAEGLMTTFGDFGATCESVGDMVGWMAVLPSTIAMTLLYGGRQVRRWRDGAGGSDRRLAAYLVFGLVGKVSVVYLAGWLVWELFYQLDGTSL